VTRKEARVSALEALYAADVRGDDPDVEGIGGRARRLVEGTWSRRAELDGEIEHAAKGWRVDRMPVVDRSVLRLALYELRHTDTPMAVVIDQAVELAKAYSTGRSGSFVNGVLGKLAEPPA
jgi:N utilization substance protein B